MKCVEGKEWKNLNVHDKTFEQVEFLDCKFIDCKFNDSMFFNCDFIDCEFIGCTMSQVKYKSTNMRSATLIDSHFYGINWDDLKDRNGKMFPIYKMDNCEMKFCNFFGFAMPKFDFSTSAFYDCSFEQCNISKGNFSGAELMRTVFNGCDLTEAVFSQAKGYVIDIRSNKVNKAKFTLPEALTLLTVLGLKVDG